MTSTVLKTRQDGPVAIFTLNRPDRRNALDIELCRRIHEAVDGLTDTRAIVVTGDGTAFCAGADLNGVYGQEFLDALYGMLRRLTSLPIPIIAAINGPAIGAGTQLAMACDLRVAGETAKFGVPTARNGMAVDAWTVRTLAKLAGGSVARRLMLAAEVIDVSEAQSCGLVDRKGSVEDAIRWAHEIAELAPLALAHNKLILNSRTEDDDRIEESFRSVWASSDVKEAALARKEKRQPVFRGE